MNKRYLIVCGNNVYKTTFLTLRHAEKRAIKINKDYQKLTIVYDIDIAAHTVNILMVSGNEVVPFTESARLLYGQ